MSDSLPPQIGNRCGRRLRNQVTTINRVSQIALNIDVARPIINVTANPLIGPDPKMNSSAAAMKVVMLASMIVVSALL